jgi:hypothetical protein
MTEAIAMVDATVEQQAGPFWTAAWPCPDPVDLGFRWSKQGRCRIAFTSTSEGHALTGVVFEPADIPRRT